jgi:hypothetical protein
MVYEIVPGQMVHPEILGHLADMEVLYAYRDLTRNHTVPSANA